VKLLRTIWLDPSDSFIFDKAAELLRLKPQNLVARLPMRRVEAVK
jgi:hypothetical protein